MKCNNCKIDKDKIEFPKNKGCKEGIEKTCKICRNIKNKERGINKEILKKYRLDFIERKGKQYIKEQSKNYYLNNKQKLLDNVKEYRNNNKDKINKYIKEYRKKYPWLVIWRRTLNNSIRKLKQNKTNNTYSILGYTSLELKQHLERKFDAKMNWGNYGEYWVVDHIKPITKFLKDTDIKIVCSLSNLQPLEKIENIKKSNKYGEFEF